MTILYGRLGAPRAARKPVPLWMYALWVATAIGCFAGALYQ